MNHEALFSAELRDCDLINRIEEQPAVTREELSDAQGEWEDDHDTDFYEWIDEPIMDLPDDLFMIFDDPDYWG